MITADELVAAIAPFSSKKDLFAVVCDSSGHVWRVSSVTVEGNAVYLLLGERYLGKKGVGNVS